MSDHPQNPDPNAPRSSEGDASGAGSMEPSEPRSAAESLVPASFAPASEVEHSITLVSPVTTSPLGGAVVVPPMDAPADTSDPVEAAFFAAPTANGEAPREFTEGAPGQQAIRSEDRPTFVFLGVVAAIALFLDIATKGWAEVALNRRGFEPIELLSGHLSITLAYNRGGAWGLMQDASEVVRRPFFLGVSAAAILFIVSLYAKLHKSQRALTWGLPLVLGGALGNLSDRITRSQVIDFIDYRADWVLSTNAFIRRYVEGWSVTDHWPTFNVADIAICVGVGLMAVDMFTARGKVQGAKAPPPGGEPPEPPRSLEALSSPLG